MKITTCQLYNDNKNALNTWTNGLYKPQSFEFDLWMAVMEIFNEGRAEWENSQTITDKNRVFFTNTQIGISKEKQGGIIAYPEDYASFSSLRFYSKTKDGPGVKCKDFDIVTDGAVRPLTEDEKAEAEEDEKLYERSIVKVDNQRWGAVAEHRRKGPSINRAYATQLDGGFRVVPQEVGYVVLNYLRLPKRPVFKYKDNGRGVLDCAAGCTELEYGAEVLPDIMSRIKMKYSSFVADTEKYSEAEKEKRGML